MKTQAKTSSDNARPLTRDDARIIDVARLRAAKLSTDPYDYVILSDFIHPPWREKLIADYPVVKKGGSFPLSTVKCGPDFSRLIDQMNGDDFRQAVEEKFSLNLKGKPTIFTVRGACRQKDGKIHTDTESKIITVLLYMNPAWENQGGRLRVLRGGTDIDDVAAEVPPVVGSLLIFRRCDHSFHGHLPFDGPRKVIQMNWVTDQKFVDRESKRHKWSSFMKKLGLSS